MGQAKEEPLARGSRLEDRPNCVSRKKKDNFIIYRDVAQFGSAPCSGRGGRKFESCHPDIFLTSKINHFSPLL